MTDEGHRGALARGLGFAAIVTGIAAWVLPAYPMGELAAGLTCFLGASLVPIVAIALSAKKPPSSRTAWAMCAVAASVLLALALVPQAGAFAPIAVDVALVAVALGVGTQVGRRVQHPGHLLPACVVVACADVASVLSPHGASHAIAENERALSLLAVSFPVPGTHAWAPALGVGDLVFVAIVLAAAATHHLPYRRAVTATCLGALAAGLIAAAVDTAVPALVPIAIAVVLGLPETRALRVQDRRVANASMGIAIALAALAVTARFLP